MCTPRLSIIVPVFNVQNRLKECVDSILLQTYQNFELILLNDGSTDDSALICKEYRNKDSRIVFVDKKNSGAGETRNAGIDAASGEYIVFIDSDDTVEPHMFEVLYHLISQKEDIDLVCCNHFIESAATGQKAAKK